MPVEIHPPDSFPEHFAKGRFSVSSFMGKWHVVYTSLPLWKKKKDVTITYEPIWPDGHTPSEGEDPEKFLDIVEYRSISTSSATGKLNKVVGVDTLQVAPPHAPKEYVPATSYKWRGKGLLQIATSRWQIIAFDEASDWGITYFASTLFTPAGIDVYVRDPASMTPELFEEIKAALKEKGGELSKLADTMFEVKHGD